MALPGQSMYPYIRVNNQTSNRKIGEYNLSHIWDGVLTNTLELQIKYQGELPQHQQVHRTPLAPPKTPYVSTENSNFPQT